MHSAEEGAERAVCTVCIPGPEEHVAYQAWKLDSHDLGMRAAGTWRPWGLSKARVMPVYREENLSGVPAQPPPLPPGGRASLQFEPRSGSWRRIQGCLHLRGKFRAERKLS